MWLDLHSNIFTTKRLCDSIVVLLVVYHARKYLSQYRRFNFSLIISSEFGLVITIALGISKMVMCSCVSFHSNYMFEYISLSTMTFFHFYHTIASQKYLILWIQSHVTFRSNSNIKFWCKFIKTNLFEYFKMLIFSISSIFVIVNYLNEFYITDKLNNELDFTIISEFLLMFIGCDCLFYYPVLSLAAYYQVVDKNSLNSLFCHANDEFVKLSNLEDHLKTAFLIGLSIFINILTIPKFGLIHLFPDTFWWNYVEPILTTNHLDMTVLLLTVISFIFYFEVSIRVTLCKISLLNYSADSNSTVHSYVSSTDCSDSPPLESMSIANIVNDSKIVGGLNESSIQSLILNGEQPMENLNELNEGDQKIISELNDGLIKPYNLENILKDYQKAVKIRRIFMLQSCASPSAVTTIPYNNYPFDVVHQQCCENVLGYATLPLGLAGPCVVNKKSFWIPLATTEGCLVASINRGFSVIRRSGGVSCFLLDDGMTRSPLLQAQSARDCICLKNWLQHATNLKNIQNIFGSTSRYAKLSSIDCTIAGNLIFLRFKALTGDAMGMNMVSKAVESSIEYITSLFPQFTIISLSGNQCSDKKAAAVNWICGRGKSVTCEINIKPDIIRSILKVSNVDKLVELNTKKNFVGSALAGSIGGFNAHASNSVAAIFAATGQDLGQIVESSNCITVMEKNADGSLYISCTMPSLEVGTVGGGTILPTQRACLQIMNVHESGIGSPSESLAMLICSTVLAGELSLLSSLCEGTLVRSHLKHNRSQTSISSLSESSNQNIPLNQCCSISSTKSKKDCYDKLKIISNLSHHKTCPML